MKRTMKCMTSLLLAVVLVMSVTITASAAAPSITYKAKGDIRFAPGSGYTSTDLFNGFKNVMPGDTITETITIKNEATDSHYIKVYLQALAHPNNDAGHQGQELSPSVLEKETAVSMNDFLSELVVTIKNGETVIYTGAPDDTAGPTEPVLLVDNLSRGNSADLTVELYVPIELGNEYANRVGEVDWKIKVEAYTNSGGGGGGGGGGDITEEIIPDEDVPLGDLPAVDEEPELEDILEEDVPLAVLPQTGLLQWPIPVMCAAGLLLIAMGLLSEQKRKAQSN